MEMSQMKLCAVWNQLIELRNEGGLHIADAELNMVPL